MDLSFFGALAAGYATGPRALETNVKEQYLEPGRDHDYGAQTFGVVSTPLWAPLGLSVDLISSLSRLPADIRLQMTGNWFWPKSVLATWEYPWGSDKIARVDPDINMGYTRVFENRKSSAHLAIESDEIERLMAVYPTLPDGRDLDLQPLHSSVSGMGELMRNLLANNLSKVCDLSSDLRNASCYGGFDALRYEGVPASMALDRVDVDLPLGEFMNDYTAGWLTRSDFAVQEESQTAVREGTKWMPEIHEGKFHAPRAYAVRRFLTGGRFPDSLVLHGNVTADFDEEFLGQRFSTNLEMIGAPQQGWDIYCALSPDCRELLENATGRVVRLPWDTDTRSASKGVGPAAGLRLVATGVDVTGDFSYGVLGMESEALGLEVVATGQTVPALRVYWSPAGGVVLRKGDIVETLIPKGFVATPILERAGDVVTVRAVAWSGKEYKRAFVMPELGAHPRLDVLRPAASSSRPVLVGSGDVDAQYLEPQPSKMARVWFREARGSDAAWSRPRIVVQNVGRAVINGLKVRYRFRANPDVPPVLVANQPNLWSIEHVVGDLYDLVLADETAVLEPGAVWPSRDGMQVGLHMLDWTPWDVFKDPSNDRNYGQPRLNETIRLWDGSGSLLWGRDVGEADPDRPVVRAVKVATREQAIGETNISKPEIEVRNDGNVPLKEIVAHWLVRLPTDAVPVLEDWYSPRSDLSMQKLGSGMWDVRIQMHDWIQPGQVVQVGSFGIRLSDWSVWDRSASPSHAGVDGTWALNPWVVVRDSNQVVLWGNNRSFDGSNSGDGTDLDNGTESVSGLRVEIRNEAPWETNTVKPRVRVGNMGAETVRGFKLEFPVVPERGLLPVLDAYWVPNCSSRLEVRTAEMVAVLECSDVNLAPGAVLPDPVGAVFALHYSDWSQWDSSNDPAFVGMGADFSMATGVRILPLLQEAP